MTFKPDPKKTSKTKTRKCKVCKGEIKSNNPLQTVCGYKCAAVKGKGTKRHQINFKKVLADEKRQERLDNETLPQLKERLQKVINEIARKLDEEYPCIARPNAGGAMDGGHRHSVNSSPNLRFNLWNIHKQSVHSNQHKGGDETMYQQGLEIRYGTERAEWIKNMHALYPILKMNKDELRTAIKKARQLKKKLQNGDKMTRDGCNDFLGIYK